LCLRRYRRYRSAGFSEQDRQPSISVDMGRSSGGRVFASPSPLRSLSTSSRRKRRLPENLDGGKKPSPKLRCAIEEPILVLVAAEHFQSVTVPVDSFRSSSSGSQYDCGWAYRKHDSGRPGRASHQSGAPGEWGGWPRHGPHRGEFGAYFTVLNRGKRSIMIDVKKPEGREAVLRLAETCDVFLENFRGGKASALGLDEASVRLRTPEVIYASLSTYVRRC
jgi:hypothetical protein